MKKSFLIIFSIIALISGVSLLSEKALRNKPQQIEAHISLPSPNLSSPEEFNWKWEYAKERIDLNHEAIFGGRKDFLAWRAQTQAYFQSRMNEVAIPRFSLRKGETRVKQSYDIHSYVGPEGDLLLAIPRNLNPGKPVVIALHGHEITPRAELPWELFDMWAGRFAEQGYIVMAPSHLWYDRVGGQRHPGGARSAEWDETWHRTIGPVDYPIEWAKRVSVLLDSITPHLPAHDGLAVVGLSAGGLTASTLMAAREDIRVGVFAGSFSNLDFNREHYRIKGHPSTWDVRWLNSLTALHALMAPRSVQWQLGRLDGFWPNTGPVTGDSAPKPPKFPGFSRYPSSGEVWGEFLILERIWAKFGAAPEFHVHEGGHVVDYSAAERFINKASN